MRTVPRGDGGHNRPCRRAVGGGSRGRVLPSSQARASRRSATQGTHGQPSRAHRGHPFGGRIRRQLRRGERGRSARRRKKYGGVGHRVYVRSHSARRTQHSEPPEPRHRDNGARQPAGDVSVAHAAQLRQLRAADIPSRRMYDACRFLTANVRRLPISCRRRQNN